MHKIERLLTARWGWVQGLSGRGRLECKFFYVLPLKRHPDAAHTAKNRFFCGLFREKNFFFIIFRYAYQNIQNSLKRKTGPKEHISQIFSSKYIFLLHLFSFLKKLFWLRTGGSLPPPPFTARSVTFIFFF